jgi:DNA-binding MarR family transcriptional regulator
VQDTLNKAGFEALGEVVTDLVALVNQSPLGGRVVREAKVSLDPALLRILAGIYRFEPVGVVELADRAGRDHTTVSRQVAKLQELGLIEKRASATDRRVSELLLTAKGRRTGQALLAARQRGLAPILARWSDKDLTDVTRLMRRLVDELKLLKDQSNQR